MASEVKKDTMSMFSGGFLGAVYAERPVSNQGADIVKTRFPPEPNGYLHLGHCKAIAVNFGFARYHGGECILRFDDTNPTKEEAKFFVSIEDTIRWLGFKPVRITHSSDNFEALYQYGEDLIEADGAYVCHCTANEIKLSRGYDPATNKGGGPRVECQHRNRPISESLREFREMRDGKYEHGKAVLRMKQDLSNPNPQMWDLAAYRIPDPEEDRPHHRTGSTWKIYPTYDFTHCICDSLEGITHSLCTTEFERSRESYEWLCGRLNIYTPMQREYGRLSIDGTVLSKRKLSDLIKYGLVHDWDDPRLYTLVALRRRGIPPGSLLSFVNDIGVTKANSSIEVSRFEAYVRKYLEITVPRLNVVLDPIRIIIENLPEDHLEMIDLPFSKDPAFGSHLIPFTKVVYIERDDFREIDSKDYFRLAPGKAVGLLKVPYPIVATRCEKDATGKITAVFAQYMQPDENGKFKKPKAYIHWIGHSPAHQSPIKVRVRYSHALFDTKTAGKGDDWMSHVAKDSEQWFNDALIEPGFLEVKKRAPWPAEAGEADANNKFKADTPAAPESVRFQGQRTAYFCEDKDSRPDNILLNRIVSLREDMGKK